jgi:hypothetical protein
MGGRKEGREGGREGWREGTEDELLMALVQLGRDLLTEHAHALLGAIAGGGGGRDGGK